MSLFTNFRNQLYVEVGNTVILGIVGTITAKLFKPKPFPLELPPEETKPLEEHTSGRGKRC